MSIFDKLVDHAWRRSLRLFHLNAGGCNGCDIELITCLTPRYDIEQLGIHMEDSPQRANVLCVSGPVTRTTRDDLEVIYAQIPEPKVVVAIGSCPATCNIFADSPTVVGPLDRIMSIDVYVPGCPPRPDAIIEGFVQAGEILARRKNDTAAALQSEPVERSGHLKDDPTTLPFPERVTLPADFRGLVQLDPERCVGCTTCSYVCSSGAVVVTNQETHYEWTYDPGRCAFCGRCVDFCPCRALSMEAERPPIYTQPEVLRKAYHLVYPRCSECGRPSHPINDVVLARAFAEITDEVRIWSLLCERCRQHRYQPALIETGYAAMSNYKEGKDDER